VQEGVLQRGIPQAAPHQQAQDPGDRRGKDKRRPNAASLGS